MNYFLFLDESGDHGLINIDPQFSVFVLCGIIISEAGYNSLSADVNNLKKEIWGNKTVIFHSRDIRKCEREFSVLFDLELKSKFYESINKIISDSDYAIITSAIKKEQYIQRYGKLIDDVYEIALSFVIERSIFFLDDIQESQKFLKIIIEKRGKKEDSKLKSHFNKLCERGTGFVSASRIRNYVSEIDFKDKTENINGLQIADLIAYPIARYVIDTERANPSFEVLEPKIYSKNGKKYGLKIYP